MGSIGVDKCIFPSDLTDSSMNQDLMRNDKHYMYMHINELQITTLENMGLEQQYFEANNQNQPNHSTFPSIQSNAGRKVN
jgi:hypothetical protein